MHCVASYGVANLISSINIIRYSGLAIIVVGLVMLIHAASIALTFLSSYTCVVETSSAESTLITATKCLVDLAIRLGFLGIYVWIGGLVMLRGISIVKEMKSETHSTT